MNSIFLSNFFMILMFTYLGYSIFSFRYKEKYFNIIAFLLCYIIACSLNYKGPSKHGLIFLCIIHTIYFCITFKGKPSNYLLALLPFPLIIIVSEIFTANILNIFAGVDSTIDIHSYLYTIAIILSNSLSFILLIMYIKLSRLFIQVKLPNFTWIIFILPISTFLFLFNLNEFHFFLIREDKSLFISIIGLLISNFVILYIFYKVITAYEYKRELKEISNKEKILSMKYDLMKNHYNINFTFLHNLLNNCRNLNVCLEEKDYIKLNSELHNLYNITFREFNAIYSNSLILNYLITERLEDLEKNEIMIKSVIEYNEFHFMSLNNQIEIFSILLDNAIECAKKVVGHKEIIFKTIKKNYQVIIQIKYSLNKNEFKSINVEEKLQTILFQYNSLYSEKYDETYKINSIIIVFTLYESS